MADLPGTAANLVQNGGFETGDLDGWSRYFMISCRNLAVLTEPVVTHRDDDRIVAMPEAGGSVEGEHALRLVESINEVGALQGIRQVVHGLEPETSYRLEMAGQIRTTRRDNLDAQTCACTQYLRLWWVPREFTTVIPPAREDPCMVGPFFCCNPANFPRDASDALLIGEWTHDDPEWAVKGDTVVAAGGVGTIMIDMQWENADWSAEIVTALVDAISLTPMPAARATDEDATPTEP